MSGLALAGTVLGVKAPALVNAGWETRINAGLLVAEIRRYRTMLIGLKERTRDGFPDGPVSEFQTCLFCHRGEQHMEGCPWSALEAEVKAILAERK